MLKKAVEAFRSLLGNTSDSHLPTEDALRESGQQLLDIINFLPDATFVIDKEGKVIAWNEAIVELTGIRAEDILGKGNYEYALPFYGERRPVLIDLVFKPQDEIKAKYTKIEMCGAGLYGEAYMPALRRGNAYFSGRARILYDSKGNIAGAIESIRDITECKRAEDLLREAEEKYRSIFENAVEGIYQSAPDGRYIEVNPAFARIFGYDSPGEFMNAVTNAVQLYVDPARREDCVQAMRKQGNGIFEVHVRRKDGSTGWVYNHVRVIHDADGGIIRFEGVVTDISEHKRAEEHILKLSTELQQRVAERTVELARANEQLLREIEERKETEELYKAVANNSYTGIYILQDGKFRFLNPRAASCFGYTQDELADVESSSIIHPQDRNIAKENSVKMLRGERKTPYEFRVVTKEGRTRWQMESVTPIYYKGKPAILGNSMDFTELKEAMQKVEEHESIEASILDAIPHPVVGLHNRRIIFANNAVESVFGWKPEELIGKKTRVFYRSDEDYKLIGDIVYEALKNRRTCSSEFFCRRKDGHDIVCRLNASNIGSDPENRRIVVVYEDITEKKQAENEKKSLEAQLRQVQKMEAIGTLAGGIAHDFNNILGAVLGNIELAFLDLAKESPVRRYLERSLKASERAVDLVKQILTFSRQTEQERRPLIINPVVKEAIKLLRATLPSSIEIRQDISYDKYTVIADPTQIHQVIMNLCTNAAHAMKETGGIMEIGLSRVDIGPDVPSCRSGLPPGPYLELTVKDTGHGMEPEIMDRIFDPFFTTKKAGEGTGMGLSVVYGIVKGCGGDISAESKPGRGSAFRVHLPIAADEHVLLDTGFRAPISRGQERILFVDDEEELVELAEDILSRLGYRVITQRSCLEALRIFLAKPDLFDLVITDMDMPNMTGMELSREILKARPDIPIILCTGFNESITPEKIKAAGIRELITKPIVRRQVAETIRHVLDRR